MRGLPKGVLPRGFRIVLTGRNPQQKEVRDATVDRNQALEHPAHRADSDTMPQNRQAFSRKPVKRYGALFLSETYDLLQVSVFQRPPLVPRATRSCRAISTETMQKNVDMRLSARKSAYNTNRNTLLLKDHAHSSTSDSVAEF